MTWFILALLAGVVSAVNVWASKLLVSGRLRPMVVGGSVHLLGGVICLLTLFFTPIQTSLSWLVILGLSLMAVIYILGNSLYFMALAQTQLSEIDVFLRSSSLWTFVGGIIFLSEPTSPRIFVGGALITLSVLLMARRARLQFSGAQLLALGAALSFGAGNVIDKALSPFFDPLSYTALNLLLTGSGMLIVAKARPSELRSPVLWRPTAWLVAVTFALTQLLIILSFQAGGAAGQVILVAQIRLIILLLVGVLVLGETDRLRRKSVAILSMLTGILLLYGVTAQ